MDYSDRRKAPSDAEWLTLDRIPQAGAFHAKLWGSDAATKRSRELTPLYAQRFVGVRENPPRVAHRESSARK